MGNNKTKDLKPNFAPTLYSNIEDNAQSSLHFVSSLNNSSTDCQRFSQRHNSTRTDASTDTIDDGHNNQEISVNGCLFQPPKPGTQTLIDRNLQKHVCHFQKSPSLSCINTIKDASCIALHDWNCINSCSATPVTPHQVQSSDRPKKYFSSSVELREAETIEPFSKICSQRDGGNSEGMTINKRLSQSETCVAAVLPVGGHTLVDPPQTLCLKASTQDASNIAQSSAFIVNGLAKQNKRDLGSLELTSLPPRPGTLCSSALWRIYISDNI